MARGETGRWVTIKGHHVLIGGPAHEQTVEYGPGKFAAVRGGKVPAFVLPKAKQHAAAVGRLPKTRAYLKQFEHKGGITRARKGRGANFK
jgi:hypothetical protein